MILPAHLYYNKDIAWCSSIQWYTPAVKEVEDVPIDRGLPAAGELLSIDNGGFFSAITDPMVSQEHISDGALDGKGNVYLTSTTKVIKGTQ